MLVKLQGNIGNSINNPI
jgi:hypothetical protein